MFLRSNARAAGLVDGGEPLQATYVAAIREGGGGGEAIAGVAAHCWNGMVLVQAPDQVAALAHDAVRRSRRAVTGFSGPWTQVVAARAALGLAAAPAVQDSRDDLYALDLDRLVVPKPLASGEVRCRHPEPEESRGRGYARSVVAGSLLAAHQQEVRRAVLFANPANAAARAAYLSIGFEIVGDYGLVLLAP